MAWAKYARADTLPAPPGRPHVGCSIIGVREGEEEDSDLRGFLLKKRFQVGLGNSKIVVESDRPCACVSSIT